MEAVWFNTICQTWQEYSNLDASLTLKPSLKAFQTELILEAVTLKNLKGRVT